MWILKCDHGRLGVTQWQFAVEKHGHVRSIEVGWWVVHAIPWLQKAAICQHVFRTEQIGSDLCNASLFRPSNIKSRPDTPQQTQPLETTPVKPGRSVKPSNRKAVVEWFQQEELSKRICYVGDKILPYFHGRFLPIRLHGFVLSLKITGK